MTGGGEREGGGGDRESFIRRARHRMRRRTEYSVPGSSDQRNARRSPRDCLSDPPTRLAAKEGSESGRNALAHRHATSPIGPRHPRAWHPERENRSAERICERGPARKRPSQPPDAPRSGRRYRGLNPPGFRIAGNGCHIARCTTRSNQLDGISVNYASTERDCSCNSDGTGAGDQGAIRAIGESNRIDSNHISYAQIGINLQAAGNTVIRNSLRGNQMHGSAVAGNDLAPFTPAATATNPWGNVLY